MMKRNDTTHSNSLPEVEITNTCVSFVGADSKIDQDKSIQKSTHIAPDDTVITEEKSVT